MGLFAKTSGEGWSFDKKTGQLTLSGELDFLVSKDFEALGKRVRSVVALKGARTTRGFDLFKNLKNLEMADLRELDVSECDSLHMMFLGCSSLVSLDLSTWDVGKVESMWDMFAGCSSLVSLDLSSWDVRKVEDMGSMFKYCTKLERIQTGPLWDLRMVKSTFGMFSGCLALRELDLSSWDFDRLEKCGHMFLHCRSLEKLDLSSMPVNYVEEMPSMFSGCESLRTLKLGGWKLEKVKDMNNLFADCGKLETLDLSGWNIPDDADTEDMFKGVPASVRVIASDDSVVRLLPKGAKVEAAGAYKESIKDYRRAMASIEMTLRGAKAGESDAQFHAGNLYYRGDERHNIPRSKTTAAEWYEKAAAQGHNAATYKLAYMYDTGDGIPMDKAKAEEWYRIAAKQELPNNGLGFLNLGRLETECLLAAVEHQVPAAQYMLGEMYYSGVIVPKDRDKAKELWKKAADSGVKAAKRDLEEYLERENAPVYTIDADLCVGCGACESTCPVLAISFVSNKCVIDKEACASCGACEAGCPTGAISHK